MAQNDNVQIGTFAGSGGASLFSPTLASPATLGNLLLAYGTVTVTGRTATTPAGWTAGPTSDAGVFSSHTFWKVSDGTETGVSIQLSGSGGGYYNIIEKDPGNIDISSLDVSSFNIDNINTPVASQPSGTAISSFGNGIAVAFFGIDIGGNVSDGRAYTNSFVEDDTSDMANTSRGGFLLASKNISVTSNETAFSHTETNEEMFGAILVWSSVAGRGITDIDGDNDVKAGQTNVNITTTDLDAAPATQIATLEGETLTVNSWSATNVNVDIPLNINLIPGFPYTLSLTDDTGTETLINVTLSVADGHEIVVFDGTVGPVGAVGLYNKSIEIFTTTPVSGDIWIAESVVGLTFSSDGQFIKDSGSFDFDFKLWDDSISSFTAVENYAITDGGTPVPLITTQPSNGTIVAGSASSIKTFSIVAVGATSYQWEFSDDSGGTYDDVVGATSPDLEVSGDEFADTNLSGRLYRCIATNVTGSVTSDTAILSITAVALPIIVLDPIDGSVQAANISSQHTFSIAATNAVSYQWQSSDDSGGTYANVIGATSPDLLITGDQFSDNLLTGRLYRCRANNSSGTTVSASAILTITAIAQTAPIITSQPSSGQVQSQNASSSHGFIVVATDAVSFQWELSTNAGSTYTNVGGANAAELVVTGDQFTDISLSGSLYRCKVTNGAGTTTSSPATLIVSPAAVSQATFVIDGTNPVEDTDGNLVTHTFAIWELRDKPMWDPTNVIIDSGVSFAVVAGVGSVSTPNGVLNTDYEFSARDAGDNPSNFIRTIGMVT